MLALRRLKSAMMQPGRPNVGAAMISHGSAGAPGVQAFPRFNLFPCSLDHNVEITTKISERPINADVSALGFYGEAQMSKLGIVGATALSLALAVATPAFAQGPGGVGMHGGGGGIHVGGGGGG